MGDLISAATDDIFERRRLKRQFEQVADKIAEQIAPFVTQEFSALPANEIQAAVILTEAVLHEGGLSGDRIAELDADPRLIERELRERSTERIEKAFLSQDGTRLFDLLLSETTNYLVDLVVGLPPFQGASTKEMLRRESFIIERVGEIFDQLPPVPQFLGGTTQGAAAVFERKYRRAISQRLDQIELFGLDLPEYRRRYNLSVAYISLELGSAEPDEEPLSLSAREDEELVAQADEAEMEIQSSHILNDLGRALIIGQAGSGKTTLLQWLAVEACCGRLHNYLPRWEGLTPFFIPLRRSVDSELPAPEDFVSYTAPQLTGVTPHGWVHDQLAAGKGMVLIDGVDELPPERRGAVRQWLDGLVASFPESKFVVTSRPPAIDEGWLDDQEFSLTELQPMSNADISSFITHWHDAAVEDPNDEDENLELDELATSLTELIRGDRAIRSLATSPLLCAMLCALHRDRKSHLPRGKLEVYRVALEGLVDRRDVEREVATGLPAQSLSLPEKLVLLRDLSYWLINNKYTDAPKEKCTERINHKLKSMPHLSYSASDVFSYLLNRSGVLREPVPGRIDFLHRTFQEYLAAAEIVEQDSMGQLVASAHSDEWREVTILAAGQARRDQRDELISGLIRRGEAESQHSHRLYLLAVACLDASIELSADRTKEVKAILGKLIPPKNMTDANALASAGDLAVPLLGSSWREKRARTAAACVRSLGLIGGEASLAYLAEIAVDHRLTVGREIIRMWDGFDPDEYAAQVLAKSPIFKNRQIAIQPSKLDYVRYLQGLKGIAIGGTRALHPYSVDYFSLEPLRHCSNLHRVIVSGIAGDVDISVLAELPLTKFAARSCERIVPAYALRSCEALKSLEFTHATVSNLDWVAELPQLETLILDSAGHWDDLQALRSRPELKTLELHQIPGEPMLDVLQQLDLERLRITGEEIYGITRIVAEGSQLESLTLRTPDEPSPLFSAPSLKELELVNCGFSQVSNGDSSGLRKLAIRRCDGLLDIGGVRSCPELSSLDLSSCRSLVNLTPVAELPQLTRLSLAYTAVTDLTPLHDLKRLRVLDIRGTKIQDLSPLTKMPALRIVLADGMQFELGRETLPEGVVTSKYGVAAPPPLRGWEYYPALSDL